ncbi:hypothetical protein VP01_1748g4 [Puccinia sorghi]|uniref:Uncharacterized protein n=1 Tax=Puccinia sorghi TaxID=27349 RepID=A0A0L6VF23_9BASI|nr:hypothetical protein VP01_1748g4 [Puccinia sorghi]
MNWDELPFTCKYSCSTERCTLAVYSCTLSEKYFSTLSFSSRQTLQLFYSTSTQQYQDMYLLEFQLFPAHLFFCFPLFLKSFKPGSINKHLTTVIKKKSDVCYLSPSYPKLTPLLVCDVFFFSCSAYLVLEFIAPFCLFFYLSRLDKSNLIIGSSTFFFTPSRANTVTRAVSMTLSCKCFHITFLNGGKFWDVGLKYIKSQINNQPAVLHKSSCYHTSNMNKSDLHFTCKTNLYLFLIQFLLKLYLNSKSLMTLTFFFYVMITLIMWIKSLLVRLHQFLKPSPLYVCQQSFTRHHSKSTGSINPDNPNHISLTKPTQLSQTIKIW